MNDILYEGGEPFIFFSYAHEDAEAVLPVIRAVKERGFRVWYDEGIEPGTEWAANIERHLKQAAVFVSLMTNAAAASQNCRDEIAYAKSLDKPSLMVYMEDEKTLTLPEGFTMQTCRFQKMFRMRFHEEGKFLDALCGAALFRSCGEDTGAVKKEEKKNRFLRIGERITELIQHTCDTKYKSDMRKMLQAWRVFCCAAILVVGIKYLAYDIIRLSETLLLMLGQFLGVEDEAYYRQLAAGVPSVIAVFGMLFAYIYADASKDMPDRHEFADQLFGGIFASLMVAVLMAALFAVLLGLFPRFGIT